MQRVQRNGGPHRKRLEMELLISHRIAGEAIYRSRCNRQSYLS